MSTKFEWAGKKFTLTSEYAPSRLFWGTDTVLEIDGKKLLKASASGFSADDETKFFFEEGKDSHIHLHVQVKALSLGYNIRVDGEEISSGSIMPENGLIAFPLIMLQCLAVSYLLSTII